MSTLRSNPFAQGGWDPEASWPNDGSFVPGTPQSSSWFPAQTAYGVLPVAATPGILPPGLIGDPFTFRFLAQGTQKCLAVVGPNSRAFYRVETNGSQSHIRSIHGIVATISWDGHVPLVEIYDRRLEKAEFLKERTCKGRTDKYIAIRDDNYAWTYDTKGFYLHPPNNIDNILGFCYYINGVEIKIVPSGLTNEVLAHLVIAVILMQGKPFVGLS